MYYRRNSQKKRLSRERNLRLKSYDKVNVILNTLYDDHANVSEQHENCQVLSSYYRLKSLGNNKDSYKKYLKYNLLMIKYNNKMNSLEEKINYSEDIRDENRVKSDDIRLFLNKKKK